MKNSSKHRSREVPLQWPVGLLVPASLQVSSGGLPSWSSAISFLFMCVSEALDNIFLF